MNTESIQWHRNGIHIWKYKKERKRKRFQMLSDQDAPTSNLILPISHHSWCFSKNSPLKNTGQSLTDDSDALWPFFFHLLLSSLSFMALWWVDRKCKPIDWRMPSQRVAKNSFNRPVMSLQAEHAISQLTDLARYLVRLIPWLTMPRQFIH